ncbi:response regulator [Gallaecimonas sp. GXIMD4217]|uniref:response regulator n=1 Tax=Gallaecimonas sp. GXIMD4217 TaxID=3131927 RepID=UPI00311ACBDE
MNIQSLSAKVGAAYLLMVLLICVGAYLTWQEVGSLEEKTGRLHDAEMAGISQGYRLQTEVQRSNDALYNWVSFQDELAQEQRQHAWRQVNSAFRLWSDALRRQGSREQLEQLQVLEADLQLLQRLQVQAQSLSGSAENFPALALFNRELVPLHDTISGLSTQLIEQEQLGQGGRERKQLLKVMADLRASNAFALNAMRTYLLAGDGGDWELYRRHLDANDLALAELNQKQGLLGDEQRLYLQRISQLKQGIPALANRLQAMRSGDQWNQVERLWQRELAPLAERIDGQLTRMLAAEQRSLAQSARDIGQQIATLSAASLAILFFAILACSVVAFVAVIMVRRMMDSIHKVVSLSEQIAKGDFDVEVELETSKETAQLGSALLKMVATLKAVMGQAQALAQGDYSQDYQVQGEQDRLGQALQQMTLSLRQADEQSKTQDWLKSGQNQAADLTMGSTEPLALCEQMVEFLATYTNAQVGACYLAENGAFNLVSSYAYRLRRSTDTSFALGEGLVGQAAREGKAMLFTDVPRDHVQLEVSSGLGASPVRQILVCPLRSGQGKQDEVAGVIVLGASQAFPAHALELAEKCAENMATAILRARDRGRLQELLEESRQQAEELQAQHKELSKANEEMEMQTQALEESEQELRNQRDQLEQANAELCAKAAELEQEKAQVEQQGRELAKTAEELAQASRYKSEFLSNMSHELRTPLNSLMLLSQSLAKNRSGNLTERQCEDLDMIYKGGQSLLKLINDILDLSKVEAGKLQLELAPVSLRAFADELQGQFRAQAESQGLDFVVELEAGLVSELTTDRDRLAQILRNLLGNAFKFTQKGHVSLNIAADGQGVRFEVSDSGIGIEAGHQESIFGAFQQADGSINRTYGGTGLGLTISRDLAQQLGGNISLESEPGQGSTFTLWLPVREVPAQKETFITSEPADERPAILIVEDDDDFARWLARQAEDNGFRALITGSGRAALSLVLEQDPKAVILDLGLADMDGVKVLESLKASPDTRDVPIHVITGRQGSDELLRKGAMGFLTKPVDLADIEGLFARFSALGQDGIGTVLIVEDDEGACQALTRLLEDKGLEVISARCGEQVQALLDARKPDCCILDFNLPDTDALSLLERLSEQQQLRLPPVIIYTGRDLSKEEHDRLQAFTRHIVIKGEHAPERIEDEVELFFHSLGKPEPAPVSVAPAFDMAGRKVLLVDDDIRNTYAISKVLKEQGLQVYMADNGELALEKLRSEEGIELVLMDVMMPVMDGLEAMRQIRSSISEQLPVIALTAKAMTGDREQCLAAGANDYLAKPIEMDALLGLMQIWLGRQQRQPS